MGRRMSEAVEIVEVGPRDGLQNEPGAISVAQKVALIEACVAAGLPSIEVGAFVSPKWVPQMADTDRVMAACGPYPDVKATVLIPNLRGLEALAEARTTARCEVGEVAVFVAASEGFSKANLNATRAETLERAGQVSVVAKSMGLAVRGYISCVTDCPFDGPIAPSEVAHTARELNRLGADTLSLGDTIGKGTPERVSAMLDGVLQDWDASRVAGHFHDTTGRALENVAVSLDAGLRTFDASVGGLGGCPYAPGAPGNLATEALVPFLHARGFATGVDEVKLAAAAKLARQIREDARANA